MEEEYDLEPMKVQYKMRYLNQEAVVDMVDESILLYATKDHAITATFLCTLVTLLVYAIARVQGRIRTRIHGGLHLFWTCLIIGDVAVCLVSFFMAAITYLRSSGHPDAVTCLTLDPLNKYHAYLWLLIWAMFVTAVLRSTVAITWLNRIRDIDRLSDLTRGVGILSLSLIYLLPLALISRSRAENLNSPNYSLTMCFPTFEDSLDVTAVLLIISFTWLLAIVVAICFSGSVSEARRCSRLAVPLAFITHVIPSIMLFVWITCSLQLEDFNDALPALYAVIVTFNALCNFFTYKLFPLATQDAEVTMKKCSGQEESNEKAVGSDQCFLEPPPAYVEKVQLV